MLVNICMKFHEGSLAGFLVTERTRPYRKIYYFQFQKGHNSKNTQSRVTVYALCTSSHVALCLCKVHENISNGFGVTERTRVCDRQTDRQTDRRPGQKQNVSQPYGGDIK